MNREMVTNWKDIETQKRTKKDRRDKLISNKSYTCNLGLKIGEKKKKEGM